MRQHDTTHFGAPIASGGAAFGRYRAGEPAARYERSLARTPSSRFVTQSHALGTPMANPASLIVAAALAVAVYIVGRRLVD